MTGDERSTPPTSEADSAIASVTVEARGHENVTAEHGSTFEVTSDDFLTPAGDCILGIEAGTVPADFGDGLVEACQRAGSTIRLRLEAGEHVEHVEARGHPDLTFESERSLVVRTSDYVDERTVGVEASKAAADFDRAFADALADGSTLSVTIAVE